MEVLYVTPSDLASSYRVYIWHPRPLTYPHDPPPPRPYQDQPRLIIAAIYAQVCTQHQVISGY
jgi:hypothetical protein